MEAGDVETGHHAPHAFADFAAFVAAHERRLRAAGRTLTGDSHLAESVVLELMASVALRWRWLGWRGPGAAATYLDRLIRREARAWRADADRRDVGRARGPARGGRRISVVADAGGTGPVGLAAHAWARAGRLRVRRRTAAAAALATLGCVALVGPREPGPSTDRELPPLTLAVPAGVRILPPFGLLAGLGSRSTRLPATLAVDPAGAAQLSTSPVPRAIAVLRQEPRPLLVLAEDGATRRVDDPEIAGARLLPSSLSPDGTRAVLVTPQSVQVLDLTTGRVRSVAVAQASARTLVWRTSRAVIVPGEDGAREVDVETGAVTSLAGLTGADVTMNQGPASAGLIELLPTNPPTGQPARIRLWHTDPNSVPPGTRSSDVEDRKIFGPEWIGMWRGVGWSTSDLFVRGCDPAALPLPDSVGRASAAVGAVGPNGLVAATLVAMNSTTMDVVGFADATTVLLNVSSPPSASILIAWNPRSGEVRRATAAVPYLQISVADLIAAV